MCYISFNSLISVNGQLCFKKINDIDLFPFQGKYFSHPLKANDRGSEGKG